VFQHEGKGLLVYLLMDPAVSSLKPQKTMKRRGVW
jgi:hypothetical protein